MAKNYARLKLFWATGATFVAFSGMVALGWPYRADLWALQTAQEHQSGFLDAVSVVLSLPGGAEVSGAALLALLAALFAYGRRALAGRLLVAFVAAGVSELAMKLFLPSAPMPEEAARAEDFASLFAVAFPYPYPSGHVLRSVLLLGALYLLSENRYLRAGLLVLLVGISAARVYLGVHWASDAVGGVLLGITALLWAFGGKADQHFGSPAFRREDERETTA